MKALVLTGYRQFSYQDVPLPSLAESEVLVEVKACGICGSDVHGMDGSTGRRRPPLIMGHEAAGIIAQVRGFAGDWKPGDRVTFDSTLSCGQCGYCQQSQFNLCENRRVLGVSCEDYSCQGALAQYVVVPHRVLYRLPDDLDFVRAAMVEPLSIAVHAAKRSGVKAGNTAVVVGAGMIGLLQIQVLRAMGCQRIVAVDLAEEKLRMAAKFGATETVQPRTSPDSFQVDHAFEAVGLSSSVDWAMRSVRKGGFLTLIGNVSPKIEWSLQLAVTRELTIRGSCASAGEYPECLDLICQGLIDVSSLISAVAPLADGADWFERLSKKDCGLFKVILTP
jgi:L-iditol 2-dehydrogenase